MRCRHGLLAGEMFFGRDLLSQLVLFHRSRIAGRLRKAQRRSRESGLPNLLA